MRPTHLLGLALAAAGAMSVGMGSARAQMAADIERLWCERMQQSLLRNYQAVETMRARRAAGIARLRPQQQVQARRNLDDWYYSRMGDLFEQRRALDAECRPLFYMPRRGEPIPREAPLPRQAPQPNPPQTWRYPPYERYPDDRTDPFSPGVPR